MHAVEQHTTGQAKDTGKHYRDPQRPHGRNNAEYHDGADDKTQNQQGDVEYKGQAEELCCKG